MKRHPCKVRDLLLCRIFTGVVFDLWNRLGKLRNLDPTRVGPASLFSTGALIFYFTGALSASTEDAAWYRFQEGEPLAYKMKVDVTNYTLADSHFFDQSEKSRHNESLALTVDYELMPIAQKENGLWKVRLLLNRVEQTVNRDGDIKQKTLDREALRDHEISGSAIMKMGMRNYSPRPDDAALNTTGPTPDQMLGREIHTAEDLFDEPLLVWIKPNGFLQKFEDRTELQQVMPGIDLKECIELALPPLLTSELKEGTQWSREVPVDLPAPPLDGHQPEPMTLKLCYTVRKTEKINGTRCARIALSGRFARDGLSIPVRKEEMKYLIWTTSITRLADQVEGEFIYDLEQKVMRTSEINSTYNYTTLAGRKEDKHRGRITSDNTIRTRLVSRLVTSSPNEPGNDARTAPKDSNAPETKQKTLSVLSADPIGPSK